jgi:hypothetical protein
MPLILSVLPDTGHHFFTRPLAELWPEKKERKESDLLKLVPRYSQFVPWGDAYPWLRFRLDQDPHTNKPLIVIAVETNLGHMLRGTLFNVEFCDTEPEYAPFCPYAREHIRQPVAGETIEIRNLNLGEADFEIDLKVHFQGLAGAAVDVDLIVDLGNTRTTAVLLESVGGGGPAAAGQIANRVNPLKIVPRGTEYAGATPRLRRPRSLDWLKSDREELEIVDSWLLLHETLFAHLEPGIGEKRPPHIIYRAEEHEFEETGAQGWLLQYFMPHAFLELSPALIGGGQAEEGAARQFANLSLDWDYRFFMSSPKRYVWSQARLGELPGETHWFQVPNALSPTGGRRFVELRGLIRYFMSTDGKDLNTDLGTLAITPPDPQDAISFQRFLPEAPPRYSYSDAVCWYALALIESAYRQINSEAYRHLLGGKVTPRRLRYVRVTSPAGWTYQERELYMRQWQRAINLFTMTRFSNWQSVEQNGHRPVLCHENLDEAICSQLPILFSETQAFLGLATKWIELYGQGEGAEANVTVMNIDIGGGTTDSVIIRYKNEDAEGTRLRPKLLFRDGYQVAGDLVVKRIIERVLIPAWFQTSPTGGNETIQAAKPYLDDLFQDPRHPIIRNIPNGGGTASRRLARIIRLLFIPLANLLLQAVCDRPVRGGDPAGRRHSGTKLPINIRDCIEDERVFPQTILDLNRLCGQVIRHYFPDADWAAEDRVFSEDAVLDCDLAQVEACIDDVFLPLFSALGGLVPKYGCNLLIVSGKPSELPRVRDLLVKAFPLLPQRILQVKNYPAGAWYPFCTPGEGRIKDAKTCTVVGAALYQDSHNQNLPGFSISLQTDNEIERSAWWGVIPDHGHHGSFFDRQHVIFGPEDYPKGPSLSPADQELSKASRPVRINLAHPHWIGRQLIKDANVRPSPVYRISWRPAEAARKPDTAEADVVFQWQSIAGKGDRLDLMKVTAVNPDVVIRPEDVHFELNTLKEEGGEFWLDNPRLQVRLNQPVTGQATAKSLA